MAKSRRIAGTNEIEQRLIQAMQYRETDELGRARAKTRHLLVTLIIFYACIVSAAWVTYRFFSN